MAMDEGQIVKWHVKPGDLVEAGQVVLEIESEKTTAEIETPVGGVVGELLVAAGLTVSVDTILVQIDDGSDEAPGPVAEPSAAVAPTPSPKALERRAPRAESASRPSPRARKLADDLGVDWSCLQGTGPGGTIVEADIRAAAGTPAGASAGALDHILRPLSPARRRVAERTAESARTAPHFFVSNDVGANALAACHAALKREARETKPSLNDLILWAVAQTLPAHPLLNSGWSDEGLREWQDVNLGFVVSLDDALVVPVIRKASALSFDALVEARADLVERARHNRLKPDDMLGGTFSVSNLGGFGVERFNSIINRGQSGILSVGALMERPALVDGRIEAASFISLTLTVDHRCVDGVAAARFLTELGGRLQTIETANLRAQ
jgi:pyruvate dehydrogenase E2 component (dihydrolipoamide acetyltransferase)